MFSFENNNNNNLYDNNEPDFSMPNINPMNLDIFGDNQMKNDNSNNFSHLFLSNANSNEPKFSLNYNIENDFTKEFSNNNFDYILINSEPINRNIGNDNINEINNVNDGVKFLIKIYLIINKNLKNIL